MPLSSGSNIYGLDGSSHRLVKEIGRGGQGSVWSLDGEPNLVAKFYHGAISPQEVKKLETMCRLKSDALSSIAAWPLTLLKESRSTQPQGLLMRTVTGHSVNQLYGIKSRLRTFPEAQFPFLLHSAVNTARAFATIHQAGQVVGDVNHSNLRISNNGTVAMIDCDSFQISDGGQVFPCPVGVPEFTPPELQGGAFTNQLRTAQHDSFGLSVLIFYMLFLGRHPFMGVYDVKANEMLALEQAIAQYKFPYALSEQSPEVRLPPFAPRLTDYPSNIGDLFKRAFTREVLQRTRPTAQEWVTALGGLSSSTKQCQLNPNHHYFSGANQCPWCRVEGVIGAAIFGVKITTIRDQDFNLIAVWAQIEAVTPVVEPLVKPDVQSLRGQYTPDPTLLGVVHRRRLFRSYSVALLIVASVVAVAEFNTLAAVLMIAGALFVSNRLWSKGALLARPFYEKHADAVASFKGAAVEFDQSAAAPTSFRVEKDKLDAQKREFEGLGALKAKRVRELDLSREQKQRQHYLERFRIEDERIPQIGPKYKATLAAWGIEDAWDVDVKKIAQIKGFGPVKQNLLLAWRYEKERLFRFEAAQPIDPRDLLALDQQIIQKSIALRSALTSGPQNLNQSIGVWQAQRRQRLAAVTHAAEVLARAEVDRQALRVF